MSTDLAKDGLKLVLPGVPSAARVVAGTAAELVERSREAAIEAAYARGVEEGKRIASEEAAGLLAAASERIEAACRRLVPELSVGAVDLAIEIAREIVRVEVEQHHHDVERIVRETLAASGVGRGACVLHVHPLDAERLKSVPFRAATRVEADPEVPLGDVHVTTPHGLLVRDQDEVLAAVRERIRGELGA